MQTEEDSPPASSTAALEASAYDCLLRKDTTEPSRLPEYKYDFRQRARSFKPTVGSWFDQDASGTYDPLRPFPDKIDFHSRNAAADDVEDGAGGADTSDGSREENGSRPKRPRPRISTWLHGRQTGTSLIVRLKVTSPAGRALLRKYPSTSGSQHFSLMESHERQEGLPTTARDESGTQPLRVLRGLKRINTESGSLATTMTMAGSGLIASEARGCKPCLELGLPCSLLEHPLHYPCDNCLEDECDCELIVPPEKKRACEACRKVRVRCSYRDGGDSSLPCERCRSKEVVCCAGPAPMRSIQPSAFCPTPTRPYLTCTPCRRARKRCSLLDRQQQPPCKGCASEGAECTFQRIDRRARGIAAGSSEKDGQFSPSDGTQQITQPIASPMAPLSMSDSARKLSSGEQSSLPSTAQNEPSPLRTSISSRSGTVKTINTRYAHPITFTLSLAQNSTTACPWCRDVTFGVFGREAVSVEVIDWGVEEGYTEIDGGHVGRGARPDAMCGPCTIARLNIVACSGHDIQPIPGLDASIFDMEEAFAQLATALSSEVSEASCTVRWCKFCPSPAFFTCRTYQPITALGQPNAPDDQAAWGCGLLLCEGCARLLITHAKEGFDELVQELSIGDSGIQGPIGKGDTAIGKNVGCVKGKALLDEFPMGVRADVGFLSSRGLLVRKVMSGGGHD